MTDEQHVFSSKAKVCEPFTLFLVFWNLPKLSHVHRALSACRCTLYAFLKDELDRKLTIIRYGDGVVGREELLSREHQLVLWTSRRGRRSRAVQERRAFAEVAAEHLAGPVWNVWDTVAELTTQSSLYHVPSVTSIAKQLPRLMFGKPTERSGIM